MRLLNRKTLRLEFFQNEPYPADLQEGNAHLRPGGYEKMMLTCAQAERDRIDYIWIDTFCIDKEKDGEAGVDFDNSEWFDRGWTLQELIAPNEVIFYDKQWQLIGKRSAMAQRLSRITKIDECVLTGLVDLGYMSIAKRMSWASERKTTRKEDIAYCLAGLFDVNMATLYGEGSEKAFRRLQEEIMKDSDDESLFAWTNERDDQPTLQGLLATSPKDFHNSSRYIPDSRYVSEYGDGSRVPYAITGRGLRITLGMQRLKDHIWVGALQCPVPPAYTNPLAIYLKLLDERGQQYARIKSDTLCKIPQHGPLKTIYVRQKPLIPGFDDIFLHHAFQLRKVDIQRQNSDTNDSIALDNAEYEIFHTEKNPLCGTIEPCPTSAQPGVPITTFEVPRAQPQLAGLIAFRRPDGSVAVLMLGSDPRVGPGVQVYTEEQSISLRLVFKRSSYIDPGSTSFLGKRMLQSKEEPLLLQPPGTVFKFKQDSFRVDIEAHRHDVGIRYYMVDVTIILLPILTVEDFVSIKGVGAQKLKLKNPVKGQKVLTT
ncbi:hypothetical protein E8E11_007005 [Didymella keratinophila]|nr:hypothetical protein E8E11_007005 [Didymella keratinophila]